MKTSTLALLALLGVTALATANDYCGLWVGQATLTYVNQVTVPLNEDNVSEPKDPAIPQPTADAAHLRLIVHVDGEGSACLLKDVAILRRSTEEPLTDNDLALVTDEQLYPSFPDQEAVRIASAVFDFGDYTATAAVDALVDEIAAQVGATVYRLPITTTSITAATDAAETAAQQAAEAGVASKQLLAHADSATRFAVFMEDVFTHLDSIKEGDASMVEAMANDLATNAVYADPRGINLLALIKGNTNDAESICRRYADTENEYQRTITGGDFAAMIADAADAAGAAATNENATLDSISNAVHALQAVIDAQTDALAWKLAHKDDNAIEFAISEVLDAIVATAAPYTNRYDLASSIAAAAENAAWERHAALPRFTPPASIPTTDYTDFVTSAAFQDCVPGAAAAAAEAAVSAKKSDPFIDQEDLSNTAKLAARYALQSVYIAAANARRTELPMDGAFGPGNGTTNLAIAANTPGGLTCTIDLPASHPTNPFRHPKHPDHIRGFDITRRIRLDFAGESGDAAEHTATGAEALAGVYREEIFGLHKKLGPDSDIGLKVEGTFELTRISHIDTLNAK
ncbi:hypothetical protein [Pontiella sp.]|uniref:hypothetical protein n=1 Tax=Pontiella sp. TaxID=2837462 RepID=UPI00356763FF